MDKGNNRLSENYTMSEGGFMVNTNDPSVGMMSCNSIGFINSLNPLMQHHLSSYKLNMLSAQARTSNDSVAQLLLNGSSRASSYVEPMSLLGMSFKANEVYGNNLIKGGAQFSSGPAENEYCESPKLIHTLRSAKLNEYCYIPASLLTGYPGSIVDVNNLNMTGYEMNSDKLMSTPSVPKTLPPSMNDTSIIVLADEPTLVEQNNLLERSSMLNGSNRLISKYFSIEINETLKETEEISDQENKENDGGDDEYQIPSNLPTFIKE